MYYDKVVDKQVVQKLSLLQAEAEEHVQNTEQDSYVAWISLSHTDVKDTMEAVYMIDGGEVLFIKNKK